MNEKKYPNFPILSDINECFIFISKIGIVWAFIFLLNNLSAFSEDAKDVVFTTFLFLWPAFLLSATSIPGYIIELVLWIHDVLKIKFRKD